MKFTPTYLAGGISRRLKRWADKRQLSHVDPEVLRFTDCLATVQTINKFHKTRHLCDIGAHKGRWSFVMQQLNPELESVVMFEPQTKLQDELQRRQLNGVRKTLYQCALGDKAHQLTLIGGTASASLLKTADNQDRFFPGSTRTESELVDVKVLDDVYAADGLDLPDLIKLDVQGFELNVLRGGKRVLAQAKYLVIELALREFYEGQPPLWELWRFLEDEQYVMVDHGYELRSPRAPHELLQFDALFMNKRFEGQ